MKPFYTVPRPTSGHHFSDLLTCPQRAWLHYYGNPNDQVQDPAYLRALQQEGIEQEKAIYEQFFPDALRIPERRDPEERCRLTLDAMRSGVPVILQGYLTTDDGVGVLDILEQVDSDDGTGYVYRVGEIKRSATLMTAHVMQASWYAELLERLTGQHTEEACFFLQDGERNIIELETLKDDYEKTKADLNSLRASTVAPGPHLSKICSSCHWRGLCMPELITNQHISLVPGISRPQADALRAMGIISWTQLKDASNDVLEAIGMGAYEIEQIRAAVLNLENGAPPFHQPLRSDIFQDLQIVVLEFADLAEQRRAGKQLVPSVIHYETDAGLTERIEVSLVNGVPTADLTPLMNDRRLAFYGLTDLGAFTRLARQAGYPKVDTFDIFNVVDSYVHSPVPGLELESLYSYVMDRKEQQLSGTDRVSAIRAVVNWMARSL